MPMYDFSIGIPFKGSQSTVNFEVPWSAVSILDSGVIDTAHHWPAMLLKPPTTGQQCHLHCPPAVSGVIDTADQWSVVSMTLLIFCTKFALLNPQCH
jgi:hypothetical protein